jgi:hypothetical protein
MPIKLVVSPLWFDENGDTEYFRFGTANIKLKFVLFGWYLHGLLLIMAADAENIQCYRNIHGL